MKVICNRYPNKYRRSRKSRSELRVLTQQWQRKYGKNFRIFECEHCNGLHVTTQDLKEYINNSGNLKSIEREAVK